MADVSISIGDMPQGTTGTSAHQKITVGEAVSAFDALYLSSADNKYYKAVDTSAAAAKATYIAVQPASADGDSISGILIQEGGLVEMANANLTADTVYCVSSTAGKWAPLSDKTTGEWLRHIGWAKSTTVLHLYTFGTDLQVA